MRPGYDATRERRAPNTTSCAGRAVGEPHPAWSRVRYELHLQRMPCWSPGLLLCLALQPCPTAHGMSPCRNLIEGEPLAESAPGPPPAKPSRAAGGGEAGAGVRLQRPPSVPLMVEDTQKTNLNPLLLDASEDFAPREGEARPGAAARPACAAPRCALPAASAHAQQQARRSASSSPEPTVVTVDCVWAPLPPAFCTSRAPAPRPQLRHRHRLLHRHAGPAGAGAQLLLPGEK